MVAGRHEACVPAWGRARERRRRDDKRRRHRLFGGSAGLDVGEPAQPGMVSGRPADRLRRRRRVRRRHFDAALRRQLARWLHESWQRPRSGLAAGDDSAGAAEERHADLPSVDGRLRRLRRRADARPAHQLVDVRPGACQLAGSHARRTAGERQAVESQRVHQDSYGVTLRWRGDGLHHRRAVQELLHRLQRDAGRLHQFREAHPGLPDHGPGGCRDSGHGPGARVGHERAVHGHGGHHRGVDVSAHDEHQQHPAGRDRPRQASQLGPHRRGYPRRRLAQVPGPGDVYP